MKRSGHAWLWLILLAAFALRLFRLGLDSLWYDETVSLYLARQDLISLTRHTAGDIHPPLYYYLLHFWGQLAGWSEFSSAFLSLFFGLLIIALVYRAGREWFTPNVALIAAFLVAISPYNLWYSQEVRMYTLGAVLGLASVYFFIRMLNSPRLSFDFAAYVLVSAAGLDTLYYFAFLLVFENLYCLVRIAYSVVRGPYFELRNTQYGTRNTFHQSPITTWLFSQLAILFLYLPWIPIAFRQAIDPPVPPWRSFTPLLVALLESFSALSFGQSVNPALVLPVLVIIAVVVGVALRSGQTYPPTPFPKGKGSIFPLPFREGGQGVRYPAVFLLGYTFVPLLLIYFLSLWKPLYHVRYVFIYSPAFYLLVAMGLDRIRIWRASRGDYVRPAFYALLLLVVLVSGYSAYNFWFDPQYTEDDVRGAVQRLAAEWRPGDAILLDAGYVYTAFTYYYDGPVEWRGRLVDYASPAAPTPPASVPQAASAPGAATRTAATGAVVLQAGSIGGAPNLGWGDKESDFYATTTDETRAALDRVFATHPRVWLLRLYDTVVDPDGIIRDYLAQRGRIIDDQGFAGESYARVQGYLTPLDKRTALPASATPRPVLLGDRIALVGFEPGTVTIRAGAPLDVNIYWQAKQPANIDEHLFAGLFSEDGKLVASTDEVPLGNGLGTSRWSPGEILREPVRLPVPSDIPPGNYILRVALYNPLTREPMAAGTSEWATVDDQIRLTVVRIQE